MHKYLAAYAGTLVTMVALDLLWLGVIARPLYRQGLGALMAEQPVLPAAVLFYLLFALGLVIFAVATSAGWPRAAAMGALFGFFAYATYDLTNLATLRDWPLGLSLLDMAWGTAVSTASAAAGRAALAWASP